MGAGHNLYLIACPVPSSCSPLSHQGTKIAKTSCGCLSSLELADSSCSVEEMLIDFSLNGSDFYWHFTTDEMRIGRNGVPVAIKTHLGPVHEAMGTSADSSAFLNNTHLLRLDTEPVEENVLY